MPYLMDWLDFIGIELAGRIDFSPTVLNMDVNATKAETLAKAEALALAVAHNGERAHGNRLMRLLLGYVASFEQLSRHSANRGTMRELLPEAAPGTSMRLRAPNSFR
ncbi:hypothetical protein [Agrobacterium leguminum]